MAARSVALVVLVLGMILGQATANFKNCYADCYFRCIIDVKKLFPYVPKKFLPCAWKCLKHCIFHDAAPTTPAQYCNLGCSLSTCEDVIDDANKLESCTADCSNNHCKGKV